MSSFFDKKGNIVIKNEKFNILKLNTDDDQIVGISDGDDVSFCFDFNQLESEDRVIITFIGKSDWHNEDDDSAKIRFGMMREQFLELRRLLNSVTI